MIKIYISVVKYILEQIYLKVLITFGLIYKDMSISDLIQTLMASFTLLAAVVALFGERFWAWKDRPKLKIHFNLAPPDCHKTQMRNDFFNKDVYYFRFLVENYGKNQAEECEVFLEKIFKENPKGKSIEYKNFTPVNLKWSGLRKPFQRTIHPEKSMFCDLGKIQHPSRPYPSVYIGISEDEKETHKFIFELPEKYFSQWDCLTPGKYQLVISVYSKNAKKITRRFNLSWSGIWRNETENMFREIVIT